MNSISFSPALTICFAFRGSNPSRLRRDDRPIF